MMKLTYTGVNTNKLHDELIAAGIVPLLVQSRDGTTWIMFDDGADEAAIAAVVAAHDPTPVPEVDPDAELVAAITAATTLAALKAALTGVNRNAAVRARVKG